MPHLKNQAIQELSISNTGAVFCIEWQIQRKLNLIDWRVEKYLRL